MPKAIRVGITGGIGSGKTTVGNYLKEKGYVVYDCDEISRELMGTEPIQNAVKKAFGESFFKDGILDRRALGDYVFSDVKRTEKLNSIFHNAVISKVDSIISRYVEESVFVIAPLLFETQMNKMFDECWVVATSEKKQRERVLERDNMNDGQFFNRIDKQMPFEKRLEMADRIINNNLAVKDLHAEVEETLRDAFKSPKTSGNDIKKAVSRNMLFPTGSSSDDDDDE